MWKGEGGERKRERESEVSMLALSVVFFTCQVTGLKDILIDYYVSATDKRGNVKKTDIYHVYIASGNAVCNGS